jgi:PAS domain S-box-containing protein
MLDFFARLLDTDGFPPRWYCGSWTPAHGWLHILSDLAICSAYFAIPGILAYFVLRRRDVPFPAIFWLFGAFILACGTTHLMEVIIFWHPVYRMAGAIKLLTAVVSWGTVVALVPAVPQALAMRTPEELQRAIVARKQAEDALQRANSELENRVQERTAELDEVNTALRHEREMLKVTLASIGDAVIVTDLVGRVTFMNSVAQALTGWSGEEARGQPLDSVFKIVNEQTRDTVTGPAERALAEGTIVGLANHTILIARDGTERPIDDSAAPIRHETGDIAGAVLVFRDVTEQRAAQRLARSLASIIESSDDAIIGKDPGGTITSWNRAAERLFGYSAEEAIGRPVKILAPPDRADEMPSILARLRQGERIDHFDTTRRAKDGRLVPISLTVSPINDQDGRLIGASKIARDISERKRAEEALREEKALLHATLTGIGDAVIVTDGAGGITMINPIASALTGWNEDAKGRAVDEVFQIINEQSGRPVESPVSRVLREGTVVGLANHTVLVRRDGTMTPIDDSAAPIRSAAGQVIGVVLVFRDVTERRRAQEAVRESQKREKERADELEAILRATPTPVWIAHDPECHRITGNPASFALLGLPEGSNVSATSPDEDPSMRGFREYQGEQPIPPEQLPVQRAARGEVVEGAEVKFVFDDGRVRYIYGNAVPLRNPDGSVRGSVAGFVDVTPLKEADEALRHSEAQFRQVADAMPQMVWAARPDGFIDYYNERWYEYTGFPRGHYGQESWEPILHPDDVERCVTTYFGCIKAEKPYQIEYRFKHRKTGGYRWFLGRAMPVRDESGKIIRWFGTCTDIDDTKRSAERLRLLWEAAAVMLSSAEPDTMLRELFASIGPHFGLDTYFNYMVNEAGDALRLVSCIGIPERTANQIKRLEFGQAICGTVAQSRKPIVATCIQGSDDPKAELIKSLGIQAYVCYPLQVNDQMLGTLTFASKSRGEFDPDELDFLQTICQYVAVAYERLRLVRKLQDADRRKDEFLATLAHELRNPLAPIRNAVELLRRSNGDDDVREQARGMLGRQLDQMVHLIDDLLDMSRISQGKIQLRKERMDLAAAFRSAQEAVQPLLESRAHHLTVTLPKDTIYLDADPTRLAQVISNLLNNAAKYTETGGHIWLTALEQRGEVVVSVRDTGVGIAPENLPHIFEMFSQVTPALERSQGGLGIGLSLVRGLVELHDGRVEAHSAGIGRGCEFVVRLPLAELSTDQKPEKPADRGIPQGGRKCRILAVDDNRDAADSLTLMLQLMGHETRTAYDGLEAVQAAAIFRPDAVLLDIGLPKMNGYEAARHIRAQPWGKRMALIALTGWGQEEDERRAVEAGFDHHLTKPAEPASLQRLLALMNPLLEPDPPSCPREPTSTVDGSGPPS